MSTADVRRLRQQVGEVIAKHERARDIVEFSKYADDPEGGSCSNHGVPSGHGRKEPGETLHHASRFCQVRL